MNDIAVIVFVMVSTFLFGAGVSMFLSNMSMIYKNKKNRLEISAEEKRQYTKNKITSERDPKKKFGTMNVILVIVGVSMLVFTVVMIYIFLEKGAVPDTLITCVFVALTGECGIMGWIKTAKERKTDREWQLEDEKRQKNNIAEHSGKE